jgi:NTE family protein
MKFHPVKSIILSLVLLCCTLCYASTVAAQQHSTAGERPRIGLVLSGGGAKGMAHIGVLKVLEEAGIRPDYITGTSMGGLVGALYALGYSASEIEKIVLRLDWDLILSNELPLNQIAIEEKPYYGRYMLELPVVKFDIRFPSGLIEGQTLNKLLSRLTRSAHGTNDFGKLPIPFACVATDLVTGEKVVLRQGFLPEAMRATMAIPTVFTPVQVDGRVLIDGGLVQNFPVQEALDMGADYIIGINVGGNLEPEKNLRSMVDVLVQATFFASASTSEAEKKKTDFLIDMVGDLEGYYTGSFKESEDIIKIGEKVARSYEDSLRSLATHFRSFRQPMQVAKRSFSEDSVSIQNIMINGTAKVPERLIRRKLRINEHQKTTVEEIENGIEMLYGTGRFSKVTYAMIPAAGGHNLQVNAEGAPSGILKTALYYDSENRAGATVNYTRRNLLLEGSRFVAEADLGQNIRTDINYLKYMGYRRQYAARIGNNYYKNDFPLFSNEGTKVAILQQKTYISTLGWQTATNNTWTIGQQLEYKHMRLSPQVAGQIDLDTALVDVNWFEQFRVRHWSVATYFKLNTMNRQVYPTRGWRTEATARYITSSKFTVDAKPEHERLAAALGRNNYSNYGQFTLQSAAYLPLRHNLSLLLGQGLHLYTHKDLPLGEETFVGGYRSVLPNALEYWAAEPYSYSADNLLYASAGLQWEIRNNLYLQSYSALLDVDLLKGSRSLRGQSYRFGYGATLGYLSPLGPIVVGLAHQRGSEMRGFISLGFRLYN